MRPQPKTVAAALLPPPANVGKGWLRPVTIGGLVLLHGLKSPYVEIGEPVELETLVAGYILSQPYAIVVGEHQCGLLSNHALAWAELNEVNCDQLSAAISVIIKHGFSSSAETKFPTHDGFNVEHFGEDGNGLGYILTMIDTLCSNYHWTLEYVLELPLITAFALIVSHRVCAGADWREPSYFERDLDFSEIKARMESENAETEDAPLMPLSPPTEKNTVNA